VWIECRSIANKEEARIIGEEWCTSMSNEQVKYTYADEWKETIEEKNIGDGDVEEKIVFRFKAI